VHDANKTRAVGLGRENELVFPSSQHGYGRRTGEHSGPFVAPSTFLAPGLNALIPLLLAEFYSAPFPSPRSVLSRQLSLQPLVRSPSVSSSRQSLQILFFRALQLNPSNNNPCLIPAKMRAVTILAVAFAGVAAAQARCEAQNIVDACTAQYKGRLSDCDANDWSCLCQESTNLLTCYNNCPKDSDRSGVQSQVTSYCGAASAANTSKTSSYSAKKTSSADASTTASSTATGSDVLSTATAVASESAAATSGSAGVVLTPAKGMSVLGGLLALAGAFL